MRNPTWSRDEVILALDLFFDEDRGQIEPRNRKIIELSTTLNKISSLNKSSRSGTFRNPNGVCLKLCNFLALDPTYVGKGMIGYSKIDKEVFQKFSTQKQKLRNLAEVIKAICSDSILTNKIHCIENDETDVVDPVIEGQLLYKLHKVRERDKNIIFLKKRKSLKENGKLACEVCGFDFKAQYGQMGDNFIECHHLLPLSSFSASKETALKDLALVCANCHKTLHKSIDNEY